MDNSQYLESLDYLNSVSYSLRSSTQEPPPAQPADIIQAPAAPVREAPKANWMCRCTPGHRRFDEIKEQMQQFCNLKCSFFCMGPLESCGYEKLPSGIGFRAKQPRVEVEPHFHFCFRMHTKTRFTALKTMLEFGTPRIEDCKYSMEICRAYCIKAGRALIEQGTALSLEERARRVKIALEQTSPETNRVKMSLAKCFDQYKTVAEFKLAQPQIFCKCSTGINAVYAERIREIPIEKPRLDWFFGPTRSGKTYRALQIVGGTNNPKCYYANGSTHWMSNYQGQEFIIFNEYVKTTLHDFKNFLAVLEGYPADQEIKGGFTPIRAKHIIITCPRPPEAMTVNGVYYKGEYESQEKYGQDHNFKAWEDVKQVVERIRESGGSICCFTKHVVNNETIYECTDVTRQDPEQE